MNEPAAAAFLGLLEPASHLPVVSSILSVLFYVDGLLTVFIFESVECVLSTKSLQTWTESVW